MNGGEGIIPPAMDAEEEDFALALADFCEIYSGVFANRPFLKASDDAPDSRPNGDRFAGPVPFNHDDGDSRA